jgi:hypothetical protein
METPDPAGGPSTVSSGSWPNALISRIQVEDLALVGVVLLGALLGEGATASVAQSILERERDPLLGAVSLIAAVGAMVAMATRVPGESRVDRSERRYWIVGPFIGAVGFTCGSALELLGIESGDVVTGPALLVAILSLVFADRLPVVERPVRRLLVAPFVLLSGAVFQGLTAELMTGLAGVVDLPTLLASPDGLQLVALVVGVSLAVSWIFYSMLVFAPRELADPGAPTAWWAVRFGVFWVSVVAGLVLGSTPVIV